jgi:hypothetical protein
MDAARQQPKPREPLRPGRRWKLALVGLVGVYGLLAGYELIANSGQLGSGTAAAASQAPAPAPAPRNAAPAASTAPRSARAGNTLTPAPKARPASQPASRQLAVTSIAPFGPDGTSDGDNPAIASRILDVSADQPWYSQWYASPYFGGLRSGTGLLLDLGSTETVTGIGLTLGSAPLGNARGADVQVRVGSTPSPGLPTVASAWNVDGTVQLTTSSARGRYVLIWFTRLPSAGQGHYQVTVYDVSVDGVSG